MVLQMIHLLPQHKSKKKKEYKEGLCYDDHNLQLEVRWIGGIIWAQQADLPHFFVTWFSKGSGTPDLTKEFSTPPCPTLDLSHRLFPERQQCA